MDGALVHTPIKPTYLATSSANQASLLNPLARKILARMDPLKPRPYADIAERLKWHREEIVKMTQDEYASSIGHKRAALSLWEAGTHRLSLDGALALRTRYGLSLDFMYEGIDDALPMTLRNAWRDRS